jgi:pyruvate/2-oxoacid:ferredoxin oxidoreductase alpha subunit
MRISKYRTVFTKYLENKMELLSGSQAVATAVKLANVDVISAYPITPQTNIIEELARMCSTGEIDAKYINVESEHSAMAGIIGAAVAGARTFTATASQGLALMHEVLHWAANGRLPIVMAVVNRALGPGWNIWTDQTDTLSQRDTGWIQLYCTNAQEVLDTTLMAYPLAERLNLPVMVVLDAYLLSHTYEPVDIPKQEDVDKYLNSMKERPFGIDFEDPYSVFQLTMPAEYAAIKRRQQNDFEFGHLSYVGEAISFRNIFGRYWPELSGCGYTDNYKAKNVLVTTGTMSSTAKSLLTDYKRDVQSVNIKLLRPFPAKSLREAIRGAERAIVVDRNLSPGLGGIWAQEVRAALSGLPVHTYSYVAGIGGTDVTEEDLDKIIYHALQYEPQYYPTFVEDI